MHRLWLLLVLIGCSAPAKPVATETRGTPDPVTTKQPAEPPLVRVPEKVAVVEAPPKTACEQDAASSECKCSQGVADSCFRLSDSEMRRGEHDSAITRVLGMCQHGTPQACFIGAKYLKRLHLDARLGTSAKDLNARGIALYEEKCSGGDQATCVEYARLLLAGKYIAADAKRGRQLVEKACEAKQARACLTLGNMYASGQGVKKDKKRALSLLDSACSTSGGAACTALAELLPASERKRATELFTRACAADDADGCARAGAAVDAAGDHAAAAELLVKACELDELKSCVRAGELVSDPERARDAFESACDAEIFAGCAGLAPFVATGKGGPRDFGAGVALAQKACTRKVPKACALVGQLRRSPPAVSCTTVDACQPLCDEKIPDACASLAQIEMKADARFGCDSATEALTIGCEAGDADSCMILGNEAQDSKNAVPRYTAACAAKIPLACVLRDSAAAHRGTAAERTRAIASLRRACTPSDAHACAWYGNAIVIAKPAEGRKLLEQGCDGGVGRACRWLADLIDTNPRGGVGDGSPQPHDEKLAKRVAELFDRGCKLGDLEACARAKLDRGEDAHALPARTCGAEPLWAP